MNLSQSIEKKSQKEPRQSYVFIFMAYHTVVEKIIDISNKYNLKIIEDCSQTHGSMIGKKYSRDFWTYFCFSFCQDKIISTGGGGMIATNKKLYEAIWSLKDIGKNRKGTLA